MKNEFKIVKIVFPQYYFFKGIYFITISLNEKNDIKKILKTLCNYYGFNYEIVLTKTRKREYVWVRFYTIVFAHLYTSCSDSRIGELIGKDHSTVSYAIRSVKNLLFSSAKHRQEFRKLNKYLVTVLHLNPAEQEKFYQFYSQATYNCKE